MNQNQNINFPGISAPGQRNHTGCNAIGADSSYPEKFLAGHYSYLKVTYPQRSPSGVKISRQSPNRCDSMINDEFRTYQAGTAKTKY